MRYYLLTCHARFLGVAPDGEGLTQIGWQDIGDREQLAAIDVEPGYVRRQYAEFVADAPAVAIETEVRHLGGAVVRTNTARKTISLQYGRHFVCADPGGRVVIDRTVSDLWESLVAVSDADMDVLERLLGNAWIVRSTRELVAAERIALVEPHTLAIGDLRISLAYNLPFERTRDRFRLTILRDGWRIDELIQFRPMIYYAAFGEENVLAQLYVSLESLVRIGNYQGEMLVFTDRTHQQICEAVPWLEPGRLIVANVGARDWVGYVAGKYCILEQQAAWRCQPVVYMDPDIVFNTEANSFLVGIAASDRLCAPMEPFTRLLDGPSVGATLLQQDHAEPRYACGFNGGTIGIPNLAAHGHSLELIRKIVDNLLAIRGRKGLTWVDQEVANYVSYRLAHFDTHLLTACVRYGRETDAQRLGPLTGLVHFWPVKEPKSKRPEVMRQYLDLLLEHAAAEAARRGGLPAAAP